MKLCVNITPGDISMLIVQAVAERMGVSIEPHDITIKGRPLHTPEQEMVECKIEIEIVIDDL